MNIIHVEDRFEPEAGYQINELIKEQASPNYNITIITSDIPIFSEKNELKEMDENFQKKYSVNIIRLKPLLVISQRFYFHKLFKIINGLNPDLVFLHGIVDFKDLVLYQRKKKYIIVRDCHMSWVASRNKFNKILPFFYSIFFSIFINNTSKYEKIYSLGVEESQYLKKLRIESSKVSLLPHGYNSKEVYYSKLYREKYRKKYKVDIEDVFVGYVGKLDSIKQPDLIFDILEKLDEELKRRIKILIVGNFSRDYEDQFLSKVRNSYFSDKIVYERAQPYSNLFKYYSALDICIWPKETTLSSIHSQVCRTIPIMEDHESNRERVIYDKYLYKINDTNDASRAVKQAIYDLESIDLNMLEKKIEERDYHRRVKNLDIEWNKLLDEKKNN